MIGVALFVTAVLIIAIWIIIELKRLKHKVFAIFLIVLILFTYLSFSVVLKDSGVDYKSVEGIMGGGKIYFSWLGGLFGNIKTITGNAIGMDWSSSRNITG